MALAVTLTLTLTAASASASPSEAIPRSDLDAAQRAAFDEGAAQFQREFGYQEGLGPQFNLNTCSGCHGHPSLGGDGPIYRGNIHSGVDLRPALSSGGPWAQALQEIGSVFLGTSPDGTSLVHMHALGPNETPDEISPVANAMSVRKAADLRGASLIAAIPAAQIRANETSQLADHPEVAGRVVEDESGGVARFGSQLHMKTTLRELVEETFESELGIEPDELLALETANGELVRDSIVDFLSYVEPPPGRPSDWKADGSAAADNAEVVRGEDLFEQSGCAVCHAPSYTLANGGVVWPWSDFLLHDMGPELDDGVGLGDAKPSEYRTAPLWGFADRGPRLLHDHRGGSLEMTVRWHGGQAADSRAAWEALEFADKLAIELFLLSLGSPQH